MAARPEDWHGVRLGLAFAASLAVHALWLAPPLFFAPMPVPGQDFPEPPLKAQLSVPALTTHAEEAFAPAEAPKLPKAADLPLGARPAVPPPSTFSTPSPQALAGPPLERALAAMTQEAFYPIEAIERGLEGTVTLLLTLEANGRVTAVAVAGGSGHVLLDAAAVEAARRIHSLPGSRGEVLLPVEFRLE